jgi:hypothetical protein
VCWIKRGHGSNLSFNLVGSVFYLASVHCCLQFILYVIGNPDLFFISAENVARVLCANIIPLPVQRGWIMKHEKESYLTKELYVSFLIK